MQWHFRSRAGRPDKNLLIGWFAAVEVVSVIWTVSDRSGVRGGVTGLLEHAAGVDTGNRLTLGILSTASDMLWNTKIIPMWINIFAVLTYMNEWEESETKGIKILRSKLHITIFKLWCNIMLNYNPEHIFTKKYENHIAA